MKDQCSTYACGSMIVPRMNPGTAGSSLRILSVLCLTLFAALPAPGALNAAQRRIAPGERMPAFAATDFQGKPFCYAPDEGRPLLLAVLTFTQARSVNAWQDLTRIVSDLSAENVKTLRMAAVLTDPNDRPLTGFAKHSEQTFTFLPDPQFRLWGAFGVIATPTVMIVDASGEVLVVKAGYTYDFEPVVRAYLEKAIGLRAEVNQSDTALVNGQSSLSAAARAERHERMAEALFEKGLYELAIRQMRTASGIDPNSLSTALRLAHMLCHAAEPNEAILAVDRWRDDMYLPRRDRAAVLQILGRASRLKGQPADAERFLEAARQLDPKSARTLFELAEAASEQKDTSQALKLYREAALLLLKDL